MEQPRPVQAQVSIETLVAVFKHKLELIRRLEITKGAYKSTYESIVRMRNEHKRIACKLDIQLYKETKAVLQKCLEELVSAIHKYEMKLSKLNKELDVPAESVPEEDRQLLSFLQDGNAKFTVNNLGIALPVWYFTERLKSYNITFGVCRGPTEYTVSSGDTRYSFMFSCINK